MKDDFKDAAQQVKPALIGAVVGLIIAGLKKLPEAAARWHRNGKARRARRRARK